MRRLTLAEVNEQCGGVLPADAVLRPDEETSTEAERTKGAGATGHGRWGRFAVLNDFVDNVISRSELRPSEIVVWLVLFRDARRDGTARTSQADIANRSGLSVRGVKNAIRNAKAKGVLKLLRRGRLNTGPSTYRVHEPTR